MSSPLIKNTISCLIESKKLLYADLGVSSALSSRHRAADVFHGSENNAPVAPLQLLHERQIVADPETSDWLLLQKETGIKTWSILDSPD